MLLPRMSSQAIFIAGKQTSPEIFVPGIVLLVVVLNLHAGIADNSCRQEFASSRLAGHLNLKMPGGEFLSE